MQEKNQEMSLARRVTLTALDLSRDPDTSDDIQRILDRVVRLHGEDAIREFVRVTLQGNMEDGEAGEYIYGDPCLGMHSGIAVRAIIRHNYEA
jgi:hypothetical protein